MEKYTPFAFYRTFLEETIYAELDKFNFYSTDFDILTNYIDKDDVVHYTGEIINRDEINHIIEFTDAGETRFVSLEGNIKKLLSEEINKTIQYIETGYEIRLMNPKEIEAFSIFLKKGLFTIKNTKAYTEFPFLESYFVKIEKIIESYSSLNDNINQPVIINKVYSFNLISDNPIETINKLYDQLSAQENGKLISCTKSDFLNAFTGKIVEKGIYWQVVGKNKKTSKVSLIYFLEKLINNGFLSRAVINDLNKYIKYIFRDKDGFELKNIKQSKSTFSKKPQLASTIDKVISSL